MATLLIACLGGVAIYVVVVARVSSEARVNRRFWLPYSSVCILLSLLILAAYLIPAILGFESGTTLLEIVLAPLEGNIRRAGLYAAGYVGLSFWALSMLHALAFARSPRLPRTL